jgi:polyisoprenoid-binding protein YceI
MKKSAILLLAGTLWLFSFAPAIFQTKSGKISFYSAATLENIEAVSNLADSKLATNGQITFIVPVKSFRFENATMQEHFNENYMESSQYPKASFLGRITNIADIHFQKDGTYKAVVSGDMEIHGVKRKLDATGTIDIKDGKPWIKARFRIRLEDYGIKGSLIGSKIAKEVEITVDCKYT